MEFTDKVCRKYKKSSEEITFDDLTKEEQEEYRKIKASSSTAIIGGDWISKVNLLKEM